MRKSRDVIRWHAERRRRGGRRRRRRSQRRALIGRLRATVCVETIGPFVSPTARPPDGRPISARRRSPLDRQTASSAEIIKGISQKKTNKQTYNTVKKNSISISSKNNMPRHWNEIPSNSSNYRNLQSGWRKTREDAVETKRKRKREREREIIMAAAIDDDDE